MGTTGADLVWRITAVKSINGQTGDTTIQSSGGTIAVTNPSPGIINIDTSGGSGSVTSVSNSDGSLTVSPTTGAVIGSINTAHSNTFSANQTSPAWITSGGSSFQFVKGDGTLDPTAYITKSVVTIFGGGVSGITSALTGTVTETVVATAIVPANVVPANAMVEIISYWRRTSGVNASDTCAVYIGGTTGTKIGNYGFTSSNSELTGLAQFWANNSTGAQKAMGTIANTFMPFRADANAATTGSNNLATSFTISFSIRLGLTTESCQLEGYAIRIQAG